MWPVTYLLTYLASSDTFHLCGCCIHNMVLLHCLFCTSVMLTRTRPTITMIRTRTRATRQRLGQKWPTRTYSITSADNWLYNGKISTTNTTCNCSNKSHKHEVWNWLLQLKLTVWLALSSPSLELACECVVYYADCTIKDFSRTKSQGIDTLDMVCKDKD